MRRTDHRRLRQLFEDCLAPRPQETPAEWCCANLVFDEPNNRGPFKLTGQEYVRDPLNDFADRQVHDMVLVWGSQTKKTGTLMGGVAYCLVNDPCGILWVFPNDKLAKRFSRQRWQRLLRASAATSRLLPSGRDRHEFATSEQIIGASVINFSGSNSAANLASNPCRRVIQDEVDKFAMATSKEADAVNLADQRTKGQVDPQRIKTSTPTLVDGLIWQEFMKGDQQRYFVPCPHCRKHVVFGWSKDYTVLPILGCEAWITWDKEAVKGHVIDEDRVKKSAHAVCPHCGGRIRNDHKTQMVRDGEWRTTVPFPPRGFRSRHLSSLYATAPETSFGVLAVKFLKAVNSFEGPQGFINGDLAEPWQNQSSRAERIEIVSDDPAPPPDSLPLLTADHQAASPFFWVVVRAWDAHGNSRLLGAYSCDDWDSLRRIQLAHNVPDRCVAIDSAYGAEVVRETCLKYGVVRHRPNGRSRHVGWTPWEGQKPTWRWKDEAAGKTYPFCISPFGVPLARRVPFSLHSLMFSGDFYKSLLKRLRKGPDKANGIRWELVKFPAGLPIEGVERVNEETYRRHIDAEYEKPHPIGGHVVWRWEKRSSHWPNHLLDCEVAQIPWATVHGRFPKLVETGS